MRRGVLFTCVALAVGVMIISSCGRNEPPEQKLRRIRDMHEIVPLGFTTVHNDEGVPSVIVDMMVTNQASEALPQLTVLVRIRDEGGIETVSQRVSLDLEGVHPGVGAQRTARIDGAEAGSGDEVTVEAETNLSDDELRALPEFSAVAGSGS